MILLLRGEMAQWLVIRSVSFNWLKLLFLNQFGWNLVRKFQMTLDKKDGELRLFLLKELVDWLVSQLVSRFG